MSTTKMRRLLDRISLAFIARRLLWGIPVLLAVVVVSFTVLRFAPGGPFDREKPLPPTIMKGLRAQYKLDRPILPVYTTEPADTPRGKELAAFEKEYSVISAGPIRITTSPAGAADTQLFAYLGQLLSGDLGVSMKYTEVNVNDILRTPALCHPAQWMKMHSCNAFSTIFNGRLSSATKSSLCFRLLFSLLAVYDVGGTIVSK